MFLRLRPLPPWRIFGRIVRTLLQGDPQPWPLCHQNHIFDVTIWFANVCNILWLAMILYRLYDYHTNKYDYDLHWIFACCSYVGSRCWIPEYFTLLYRCGALGSTTMGREAFHQHLKGVQLPMNDEQEQKSRTKMDGKQILFGNPAKRFEEDVKIFFESFGDLSDHTWWKYAPKTSKTASRHCQVYWNVILTLSFTRCVRSFTCK